MNFGTFLLGVTEGLDTGVRAGERISAAMDAKSVRDAAKKASEKNKQAPVTAPGSRPATFGTGSDALHVPNSPMAPPGAPTAPTPPTAAAPSQFAATGPAFPTYNGAGQPAARLGVGTNPYGSVTMPAGVQRRWGVTGDPSVIPYTYD